MKMNRFFVLVGVLLLTVVALTAMLGLAETATARESTPGMTVNPQVALDATCSITAEVADLSTLLAEIHVEWTTEVAGGWVQVDFGDGTAPWGDDALTGTVDLQHFYGELDHPYTASITTDEVDGNEPSCYAETVIEFIAPPMGTLDVMIVNMAEKEVSFSGSYTNADTACLYYDDGQFFCNPGLMPEFANVLHQYDEWGEKNPWLELTNEGGTTVITETFVLEPPMEGNMIFLPFVAAPESEPSCTIQTTNLTEHLVSTRLHWVNFPEGWSFLFWGDEPQTGQEPVGFEGPNGEQSWSHVYNDGDYSQEAKILQNDQLITICSNEIEIP